MKLTVFTPTYNRGILLEKLYSSLLSQETYDFEWLIVDDASEDNTESLVEKWIIDAPFNIRYIKQDHGGKHRALNKAFNLAEGRYFFIVDSDDWLLEDAISYIYKWIDETENISYLAGVSGLRVTKNQVIGGIPKVNKNGFIDASNFERNKYNLGGDKAEIYKTEILRRFPFPEFENEYFVTEAVCWDSIANAGYKVRWYNTPIYYCEYLEGGLTKSGANELSGHISNFNGYTYYVKQRLDYQGLTNNITLLLNYLKVCNFKKIKLKNCLKKINISYIKFISYMIQIPFRVIYNKIF